MHKPASSDTQTHLIPNGEEEREDESSAGRGPQTPRTHTGVRLMKYVCSNNYNSMAWLCNAHHCPFTQPLNTFHTSVYVMDFFFSYLTCSGKTAGGEGTTRHAAIQSQLQALFQRKINTDKYVTLF